MTVNIIKKRNDFGGFVIGTSTAKKRFIDFVTDEASVTITDIDFTAPSSDFTIGDITLPKVLGSATDAYELEPAYSVYQGVITTASGKVYRIAGDKSTYRTDAVLYSEDSGFSWNYARENGDPSGFGGRSGCGCVEFLGKLWVYGGLSSAGAYLDDVWSSSDGGTTWTLEKDHAGWTPRYIFGYCVFDSKMWMMGGLNGLGADDQVWSSVDGVNWTLESTLPDGHVFLTNTVTVYDSKIWVIGRYNTITLDNTVAYSSNGSSWTKITPATPFTSRIEHSVGTNNGKLVVGFGQDGSSNYKDDFWESTDGNIWTRKTTAATGAVKSYFQITNVSDGIVLIGGYAGGWAKEVWFTSNNSFFIKRRTLADTRTRFSVTFNPPSAVSRDKTATIEIDSTDSVDPTYSFDVTGRAYTAETMTLTPSTINFGTIPIGVESSEENSVIETTIPDYITCTSSTVDSPFEGKLLGVDSDFGGTISGFPLISNPINMNNITKEIISETSIYDSSCSLMRVGTSNEYILLWIDTATNRLNATILEITDRTIVNEKPEKRTVIGIPASSYESIKAFIDMGNDRYIVAAKEDTNRTRITLFSYSSGTFTSLNTITNTNTIIGFTGVENFDSDKHIKMSSTLFVLSFYKHILQAYSIAGDSIVEDSSAFTLARPVGGGDYEDVFGIYELSSFNYAIFYHTTNPLSDTTVYFKIVTYNDTTHVWDESASWNSVTTRSMQAICKKISSTRLLLMYSNYALPPVNFYAKFIDISGTTFTATTEQNLSISVSAGCFIFVRPSGKIAAGVIRDTGYTTIDVYGLQITGDNLVATGETLECDNFNSSLAISVPFVIIDEYSCLFAYNHGDGTVHACVVMLANKVSVKAKGTAEFGTKTKTVTFTFNLSE